MKPTPLPTLQSGKPTAREEAVYAFLVEKRSRSGSTRTVESYARMLWPFFRVTTPDRARSSDVLAYAHGIGCSGRVPSSTTVGARIACLSSFYRFTIRMSLLTANPCDALERPRTVPSVTRGYTADEVIVELTRAPRGRLGSDPTAAPDEGLLLRLALWLAEVAAEAARTATAPAARLIPGAAAARRARGAEEPPVVGSAR